MKSMRSPWFGGGLLFAVVLAGFGWRAGYFPFLPPFPGSAAPRAPAAAGPAAPKAQAAPSVPTNANWPALAVELDQAQANFLRLVDNPPRDPFQMMTRPPATNSPAISPVAWMRLNAIWRQSDTRAAVINSHVYLEGETVQGLRLERVDADQVWFKGPEGLEPLAFKHGEPPPALPGPKPAVPSKGLFGAPVSTANHSNKS